MKDTDKHKGNIVSGLRGAIYTRFSTDLQHSTEDQVRECRRWADENGVTVEERHVFSDEGITGRSSRRPGLKLLQAALEADEIDVVIIFATNRLYRMTHRSLAFVEEQIIERGKRCVFVASGIDTAKGDDWWLPLQVYTIVDEFTSKVNVRHIQAAHIGQLEQRLVYGTLPYGFAGEVVPGRTTRRGRPARRIVIDPVPFKWRQKLLGWYADGATIQAVVRRLNEEGAPVPDRCVQGRWSHQVVRRILSDPHNIGIWSYGVCQNRWLNSKSYSRQFRREEPLRTVQFDDLRVIDDATWRRIQTRLATNRNVGGRKAKGGSRRLRPRLLNGFLHCSAHRRPLTVTGTCGKYVACPVCKAGGEDAALYSMLDRDLATELICVRIAELMRTDTGLADEAVAICQACAEAAGRPDPAELENLRRQERRLTQQIDWVLSLAADTEQDKTENAAKVKKLRADRAVVQREITELEEALRAEVVVPDLMTVRQRLDQISDILLQAATSDEPEPRELARELLRKLTGGVIELQQCGERKRYGGWLQARFRLRLLRPVLDEFGCRCKLGRDQLVTVDIRKPTLAEKRAAEVRALYDRGLKQNEIARRLKINRNSVRKTLDASFEAEGKTRPDGRSRRWHVSEDQQPRYKFREIADEVMAHYQNGLALKEIADRVGADRNTVAAAIAHWHEQRGLTAPDGRARRKRLREERDRVRQSESDAAS